MVASINGVVVMSHRKEVSKGKFWEGFYVNGVISCKLKLGCFVGGRSRRFVPLAAHSRYRGRAPGLEVVRDGRGRANRALQG